MQILRKILDYFRQSRRQDREKGAITVAETLIALGVGATVLAVVFAGIPALTGARDANQTLAGLSQLSTAIRSTFSARPDFTGLNNELARQLAGYPPQFRAGANLVHPWGGDITIAPATGNTRRFTVLFEDVPSNGCTTIAAATVTLANSIQVGTTVIDLDAVDDPTTTGVDESAPANIAGLCTATDEVDVTWTFSA